jgi:hypothetical protein
VTGAEFSGVDLDRLADYVGGALIGTPDEAAVAALIAGDPAWQVAHDELADAMVSVGVELNALGAVSEPMPPEIARRLDAAFASAVADPAPIDPELAAPAVPFVVASGAGAASGRHLSAVPDDAVDLGERKRTTRAARLRRLRWAAPIAVAVGVIAFVGVGINYMTSQSSSDSATSSAAGSSAEKDSSGTPMMAPDLAGPMAGERTLVSGRDYQLSTLASALRAASKANTATGTESGSTSGSTEANVPQAAVRAPLDRLTPAGALRACLDAIALENAGGAITEPVVDYARFEGTPALIVRFTASNGEWVWATGSDCGLLGSGAAKLASVKVG